MNTKLEEMLREAGALEVLAADLYLVFCQKFPEDREFWWQLVLEEQNHAALFEAARESFLPVDKVPLDLVPQSLEILREATGHLRTVVEQWKESDYTREQAFETALTLERSAAELHLQEFARKQPSNKLQEVFQRLIDDDRRHGDRIEAYLSRTETGP